MEGVAVAVEPIIIRLPSYFYTKLETFFALLPSPSSPFSLTSRWFLLPLCPWPWIAHHLTSFEGNTLHFPKKTLANQDERGERRDERRAELEHEYEEKENGPKFSRNFGLRFGLLEERSRTRASSSAAAAEIIEKESDHREGERRCPRQAPARGVGEDRGLNRWGGLLSVRADLQILPRPA